MAGLRKNPKDERLPKYVYLKKGRYVYVTPRTSGKLGPEVYLAPGSASLRKVWESYEGLATTNIKRNSLLWLCNKYLSSPAFAALRPSTKAEYLGCHQQVISKRSDEGDVFGEIPFQDITPGVLLKYRDARAQKARVRANRELTYLSIVFSWAYERDIVKTNPAKGVKRLPEAPRTRYIEDGEYEAVYRKALGEAHHSLPRASHGAGLPDAAAQD